LRADEPLNALSNLAFFVAAIAAYRLARRRESLNYESGLLIGLIVLIGVGSSLFHLLASRWAGLADVLPILFYQVAFIGIYALRAMKWGAAGSAALVAAYVVLSWLSGLLPRDWLNGSLSYAPAWLFLFALGAYHYRGNYPARATLLLAGCVFTVSLAFRSLDMWVCPAFPFGLHYLWHLLNALVLFLTVQALLVNLGQSRETDSR
jgi:hypothetical protein